MYFVIGNIFVVFVEASKHIVFLWRDCTSLWIYKEMQLISHQPFQLLLRSRAEPVRLFRMNPEHLCLTSVKTQTCCHFPLYDPFVTLHCMRFHLLILTRKFFE